VLEEQPGDEIAGSRCIRYAAATWQILETEGERRSAG
jgi:hypothetical protein